MRTNGEAALVGAVGTLERCGSVPVDQVARALRAMLRDYAASRPQTGEAFDANRLVDAIDTFTRRR